MPKQPRRRPPARLTRPLYRYVEADRLAGLTRGTAKRWLSGYRYASAAGETLSRPPVARASAQDVSFLELVELAVIGGLRRRGFSLAEIHRVVAFCEHELKTSCPLASMEFKTGGHDIFVDRGSHLLNVLRRRGAQAWNEVLGPFLDALDYEGQFARRWWPLGHAVAVVVDPELGFGLPVVAGSGVRTEIVAERLEAGDPLEQVASDFNLARDQVEQAREFERTRRAA